MPTAKPVKSKKEIELPCPRCGKRICDCTGMPEGRFEIELKCPGSCGYVWLGAQYIRKIIDKALNKSNIA
jgi:Zn-finger nucleic acid-binding protein